MTLLYRNLIADRTKFLGSYGSRLPPAEFFMVTGLARSGTTAIGQAIGSASDTLVLHETFKPSVHTPDMFRAAAIVEATKNLPSWDKRAVQHELLLGKEARPICHKRPGMSPFLRQTILEMGTDFRVVMAFRPLMATVLSTHARASNPSDPFGKTAEQAVVDFNQRNRQLLGLGGLAEQIIPFEYDWLFDREKIERLVTNGLKLHLNVRGLDSFMEAQSKFSVSDRDASNFIEMVESRVNKDLAKKVQEKFGLSFPY